jgi:hypothetical protein
MEQTKETKEVDDKHFSFENINSIIHFSGKDKIFADHCVVTSSFVFAITHEKLRIIIPMSNIAFISLLSKEQYEKALKEAEAEAEAEKEEEE